VMDDRGWVSVDGKWRYNQVDDSPQTKELCCVYRFHRPIEGEEGYEKQDAALLKQKHSSLAQIVGPPIHARMRCRFAK
jgi:hypothetical protein